MGASLTYNSNKAVTAAIRGQIEAEAKELSHDWWAESIVFFDDPHNGGRLYGDSKLFLIGYSTDEGEYREIDPSDDSLMAWRDASFIITQLERWSVQHGITWQLSCAEKEIGMIKGGILDKSVKQFLADILRIVEIPIEERDVYINNLLDRYADRWDAE